MIENIVELGSFKQLVSKAYFLFDHTI
uniref:Uncharacterized protein n=1 Tax=Arundo donax TaxID=35708 RepID=A0A0A9AB26_ARUDO